MNNIFIPTYSLVFTLIFNASVYALEAEQQPKTYIFSINNISNASEYIGWSTVAKKQDGELLLTYSGGREGHECPYGRVELMRSDNNGQTWSKPRILVDSILDDRDSGVCQTSKGTLLITWFTSTEWEKKIPHLPKEKKQRWQKMLQEIESQNYRYPTIKEFAKNTFDKNLSSRYNAASASLRRSPRLLYSRFKIDQWMIRSEDDGKTWSQPYLVPMMSPHGPIVASDGRLLLAGKTKEFVGLCESKDDGKTWDIVSKIEPIPGHESGNYHELHIAEAANGTLIVQIRNHDKTYKYETLQTESTDGGKTWTQVHSIGVWGHPSHLVLLKNSNMLMSYSYRGVVRKPAESNRVEARISSDNGSTWSSPVIISDNLYSSDFGYPSSVELDNGKILTIWYELQSDSPNAVLRQAVWEIRL